MMMDNAPTILQNPNDPMGVVREISPENGSTIKIDRSNELAEKAKTFERQINAVKDFIAKNKNNITDYEYIEDRNTFMIFQFIPTRRMTSMSLLNFNAPSFYDDEEDFSGKTFFAAIAAVADQFEMNPEELYDAISGLFYTTLNSHDYYYIAIPQ